MGKNGPEEIDATAEDYEPLLPGAMNMAISMTADLLRAYRQP